jgi:hypothetical protein
LKLGIYAKEVRRRVSTEEEDPRMEPHSSLRLPIAGEDDWRGELQAGIGPWREKMKVEERK